MYKADMLQVAGVANVAQHWFSVSFIPLTEMQWRYWNLQSPIFLCIFWMLSMVFFPISTPCKVTHHILWKGTILKRTWNIFQASLFRDIAATLAAKKNQNLRGYDIAQVREHDHLEPLGPWKRMGKVEKVEVAIVFTKNLGCIFFLCCKMAIIFWVWFFVLRIWKKHSYCSYNPRELSLKPGISSTCFDLPLLAP